MNDLEKRVKILEIKQGDWVYNPQPKGTPEYDSYQQIHINAALQKLELA